MKNEELKYTYGSKVGRIIFDNVFGFISPIFLHVTVILNNNMLVRRLGVTLAFWINVKAVDWALTYASSIPPESAHLGGALIGAVLTPLSGLSGYLFKVYGDNRKVNIETKIQTKPDS